MEILEKAATYFQLNLPFVLFTKPNKNQLNAYFQHDDELHQFENQEGFVFVSFDGKNKVVLPKAKSDYFSQEINFQLNFDSKSIDIQTSKEEENKFKELVNTAVEIIKSGKFKKLVVSRKIDFSSPIYVFQTYQNLLKTYPSAFRYLFFHPRVGMWIGATPEQLVKVEENQFETVALAGTQLFSENVHWEAKEIQEQQFVTDYIVENCKQIATYINISEPFTVQAGKLAHIKTIISGKIENDKLYELVSKLHPTPAVCGLPKESAKEFILKNESYDRKFYTGFLGEWNVENRTNLFVNLRCMEIGEINSIYVGCGVTKDSEPEKEFTETQNKAETIKNIIITK
jgi:isochorismate synthase